MAACSGSLKGKHGILHKACNELGSARVSGNWKPLCVDSPNPVICSLHTKLYCAIETEGGGACALHGSPCGRRLAEVVAGYLLFTGFLPLSSAGSTSTWRRWSTKSPRSRRTTAGASQAPGGDSLDAPAIGARYACGIVVCVLSRYSISTAHFCIT